MPTNVTYEYEVAEKRYFEAKTNEEKLIALKEMLSAAPTHKGCEKLRSDIKQRISKLKSNIEKDRAQKKKASSISIKKEGAATITIVGCVNSGKSTLLNFLSKSERARVSEYPYTTSMPEISVMDYKGIKVQIVEIPAITKNYHETKYGPSFLSIVRASDLVVLLLRNNYREEIELILSELRNAGILVNEEVKGERAVSLKGIIVLNSKENFSFKNFNVFKFDEKIKENLWNSLDLIYVYTKTPGKPKNEPPIALAKNSNIEDIAKYIHKDFLRNFKYARIWGESSKFKGSQIVGLKHALKSGDVIEIHIK